MSSVIALGSVLGSSAWLLVTAGNVMAAFVMGWSLWRSHPSVWTQWNLAMSGRDDVVPARTPAAEVRSDVP